MPKPTHFLITSVASKVYHASKPKVLRFGGGAIMVAKCGANSGFGQVQIMEAPAIPEHLRLCRKCANVYYD